MGETDTTNDGSNDRTRVIPTRIKAIALAVGVGHLLALVGVTAVLEGDPFGPTPNELLAADQYGILMFVVSVAGMILLGAIPAVLALRWRLVTPLGFVAIAFGWATYQTWLRSLESVPGAGAGISPSHLSLYAFWSPLILVIALLCGGLEYVARRRFG
ncbi:hypothetical protein G6M89_07775 [Natronolimnobius sp. AArcel1]|uniref:hypothetical protein n=1 Tax=Natronolimnobius sp. AArcel1 TaxID=1679093 RepID=UPI0013EC661A|nr:hypothetical protein [Natronolimnobius sp. AArcel1]NGM68909.1 hypothetical protein [Natronolimnobius sp. AArcel1]